MGVNSVTLSTRFVGLDSPREQMDVLRKYRSIGDSL